MNPRSILYINIDSFCAVVEQGRRVELCGRPVIVGRARGNSSGVVVSASREARKFGVEDGMGVRQAQRACPDAVVLSEDRGTYVQVFNRLLDILAQYSPLLEPDLMGCAYLDVTGSRCLFGSAEEIANRIGREVRKELGLRACVGIASSKLLARVASRSRRGGVVKVCIGFEDKFLSQLPVGALDSVRGKIAKRLGELGVSTIGQLAMIPEALLVRQFGPVGSLLTRQALGIDMSQVKAAYPPDIIIGEHMFEGVAEEPAKVWEGLGLVVDDVVMRLRKRGGLAGEVMLEIVDEGAGIGPNRESAKLAFQFPISSAFRFKKPTDSAASISQALEKMLMANVRSGMEVSRVRVVLSELTAGSSAQLCLIGDGERRQRLERAVELLKERFGERSVRMAGSF